MSIVTLTHVATGLIGIAAGVVALAGVFRGRPMAAWNALFLSSTAAACATGYAFLPSQGVTSAQLVSFYLTFLLAVAGYACYVRRLRDSWNQVYALAAVGIFFLDVLITTAQSFLHVRVLRALAPTQRSPAYVAVKIALFAVFVVVLVAIGRRAGRPVPRDDGPASSAGNDAAGP